MAAGWLGLEREGSSGGGVGALGEPTPSSDGEHVTSGRAVGAKGELTSTPEREHVGSKGGPTCLGGGGKGGDVGAKGETTSTPEGEHMGAEGKPTCQGGGGRGGEGRAGDISRSAPSSCGIECVGEEQSAITSCDSFFLFLLLDLVSCETSSKARDRAGSSWGG